MRITGISTHVVDAGDRDWIFVRVDTDQAGLVGYGEASLGWHTGAVRGAVEDLARMLVGDDPRPVERLWQRMVRGPYFRGGIAVTSAIAGIDQALWDIKARSLGVPLYELLGGPVRDRIRTYVNLGSELGGDARDPDAWGEAARNARKDGFDAMKIYPVAPARPLEGAALLRRTEELVGRVREAAGDDADVLIDLHGRATPPVAIELADVMAPFRPYWLEEPVPPGSPDALADVARVVRIPIAAGERLGTAHEFRELLDRRACAVIQPNVCYAGGISGLRRIAAMAEPAGVSVAPHNPNGPIGTLVSVHLALALDNILILEQVRGDVPWRWELVDRPIVIEDGYASPPAGPGIGVELVDEVAREHPGLSPAPHTVAAPDGGLLDW
jgi:galactonate dehydratase